jgi:hypothetical protein
MRQTKLHHGLQSSTNIEYTPQYDRISIIMGRGMVIMGPVMAAALGVFTSKSHAPKDSNAL